MGAGNGGLALAGHLAIMGFDVTLWNRSEERLKGIRKRGGIEVSGAVEGFARIKTVTTDVEEAISQADVIMVAIPATGHGYIAEISAPYLREDQIVILNPGRTGGALEFTNVLERFGKLDGVIVSEAQTFLYASRTISPCRVMIKRIKNSVPLAALPAYLTPHVLRVIRTAFPQFVPSDTVLNTSFNNIGAVFHPALLLLNASRVELNEKFDYYVEGVTPSIARVLEEIDKERVAVATALGVRTYTAREWLYLAYDVAGKTLYEALQNNPVYVGISAPNTLNHRYITEDVPTSLVPLASIGEMLKVPTPVIRSIIHLASTIHGVDYWKVGRTAEKLGLKGLSVREIRRLALEGHRSVHSFKLLLPHDEQPHVTATA
ncbi:TPA: NADP transhydrogenase subunit alpha [Candidatus Poribacteria bacterium]|nr:NADP transhydrogenase subunit alpha [Candidatus Poribacteria bacterium]